MTKVNKQRAKEVLLEVMYKLVLFVTQASKKRQACMHTHNIPPVCHFHMHHVGMYSMYPLNVRTNSLSNSR